MTDPPSKSSSLRQLASGFRGRTMRTAKIASKAGVSMATRALGVPTRSSSKSTDKAHLLLQEMNELKGLVMKFGQMASYLEGALPPEAQAILSELQANSTPLDWSVVRGEVERGLGAPVEDCFESFDTIPFAAASIGQVHRARVAGVDVAVKVQYPGIADALRSDLDTLGSLARLALTIGPLDGRSLVAELRGRMLEECDYIREAENQRLFSQLLTNVDGARVPNILASHSSKTVLTSELDSGMSLKDATTKLDQDTLNRVAAVIFESCFRCLFQFAVFNGDPHPGNYLVHPNGDVTFLDFGCVRRFEVDFIDRWKLLANIIMQGDRDAFPDAFRALGWIATERGYDWESSWQSLKYLYRPFLSTEPFTYTNEYVLESYQRLIVKNPNKFKTTMPPEWLLLNRLQWGLNSVFSQLRATGQWGDLWIPIINTPTEPR